MKLIVTIMLVASVAMYTADAHGALYWPTPRNAMDNVLPEYAGGRSPTQGCTCTNGNGDAKSGCDLGLRGTKEGLSDGQACLWWSQGCSIGCEKCATEIPGFTAFHGTGPQAGKIGFRTRYCNATFNSKGAPVPLINSTIPKEVCLLLPRLRLPLTTAHPRHGP